MKKNNIISKSCWINDYNYSRNYRFSWILQQKWT